MLQRDDNNNKKPTSLLHNSYVAGSLAGFIETCITHPLWTIKTKIQQGVKINYHPKYLYKGFVMNLLGFMPTTSIQMGVNQSFKQQLGWNHPTYIQSMSSAFLAGVLSSSVSCPVERIMTLQGQVANHGLMQREIPSFFAGQTATGFREGVFSVFFISISPILKKEALAYCNNDVIASLLSGAISGVTATLISQPFDTIKTIQQSSSEKNIGFFNTAKNIHTHYGLPGFFAGTTSRGSSVILSVTLMSWMKEKMDDSCTSTNSRTC